MANGKRNRSKGMLKFVIIIVLIIVVISFIVFLAKGFFSPDNGETSTPGDSAAISPTPDGANSPELTTPGKTDNVINPGTDSPIYVGNPSRLDFKSNNNEYIASAIKERLMETNFLFVEDGTLEAPETYKDAFEIIKFDEYIKLRIKTSASEELIDEYYEELLTFLYDNNAKDHKLAEDVTPAPTPDISDSFFITLYLWHVDN